MKKKNYFSFWGIAIPIEPFSGSYEFKGEIILHAYFQYMQHLGTLSVNFCTYQIALQGRRNVKTSLSEGHNMPLPPIVLIWKGLTNLTSPHVPLVPLALHYQTLPRLRKIAFEPGGTFRGSGDLSSHTFDRYQKTVHQSGGKIKSSWF